MSGIYLIRNIVNNKVYVGKTTRLFRKRKNDHWNLLKRNIHKTPHLQNAWNKYGENNFKFEIIEECEKCFLSIKEEYWINEYKSYNRNFGYNSQRFSNNIQTHSDETKTKIRLKALGRKHSLENINKRRRTISWKFKAIEAINCQNGEVLEFQCIRDATKFGFSRSSIQFCLNGKYKQHAGYFWQYLV